MTSTVKVGGSRPVPTPTTAVVNANPVIAVRAI